MFDLFRSREKAVRITLTVLLGLVGLSMVTYLIPSSGVDSTTASSDSSVVAKVGKIQLTSQQVNRVVQNLTRQRQLPPDLLSVYVPTVIQQMITERAMAYEAERLGMKVNADETDNAILDQLPAEVVKDGKVDSATLNAMLQQQGVSMTELKEDTARGLLAARLRQTVSAGVFVSPRDVESEYHRRNDKVKIEFALVSPAKYQAEAQPTDAELAAWYNGHKSSYQTSEKRSVAMIVLDPGKVSAAIQPTDADLHKEYTASMEQFRTPERVQVRHILIKSTAADDADRKLKAEGVLKLVQKGEDFAKLADRNSDDPGSAKQGGELGFIVKGQTVPEFEKAAFSLQPGQTSDLVKTTYGYHVIQVEKHEQARLQPFEEVRAQLTNSFMQRALNEQMQKLADKAVAELRKDSAHPEKAAAAVGTTVVRAENVKAGDPLPVVGASKELNDALAPLHKGEVTAGPVVLPGNRVVVAVVTDYAGPRQATLEEAKEDVRNGALGQKLQDILTRKAADLEAKAKALNGDLVKAGKELGIEVKTSPDIDRQGALEGVGNASQLADAFVKPVGTLIGPVTVPGGRVLAKVAGKTEADMAGFAAQSTKIRDELKTQKSADRTKLFEEGLKKRLQNEGKLTIRQDVVARILQNLTGKS